MKTYSDMISEVRKGEGFAGWKDPWAVASDEDRKEMYRLWRLSMKTMPGSPRQKEIIKKLNALRAKYKMKPIPTDS